MKDNDVIKAIEYCLEQGITSDCERCKDKIGCRDTLLHNALDLINRQKAEIERIEEKNKSLYKEIERIALKTSEEMESERE